MIKQIFMVNFDFDSQVYMKTILVLSENGKIQSTVIKFNLHHKKIFKGLSFRRIDQPIPVLDFL